MLYFFCCLTVIFLQMCKCLALANVIHANANYVTSSRYLNTFSSFFFVCYFTTALTFPTFPLAPWIICSSSFLHSFLPLCVILSIIMIVVRLFVTVVVVATFWKLKNNCVRIQRPFFPIAFEWLKYIYWTPWILSKR